MKHCEVNEFGVCLFVVVVLLTSKSFNLFACSTEPKIVLLIRIKATQIKRRFMLNST